MNNEIYLKSKTVYGKNLIYPDCDTARIFLNLTHSKTFSDFEIGSIKKLGYKVFLNWKGGTML